MPLDMLEGNSGCAVASDLLVSDPTNGEIFRFNPVIYHLSGEIMADSLEPTQDQINRANRSVGGSLILSSIRCTLQYIVLPFVLPLLGFGGIFSSVLTLVLSAAAVTLILYNVVELWPTSWRWRYLGLATVLLLIMAVFLVDDVRRLLASV